MKIHEITLDQIKKDLIESRGEVYANGEIKRIKFCAEERDLIYFLARENNSVPESVLWENTDFIKKAFGENAEKLNYGYEQRLKGFKADLKKYEGNEFTEDEKVKFEALSNWWYKNKGNQQTLGQIGQLKRVKSSEYFKELQTLEDKRYKQIMYERAKQGIEYGKSIVCKLVL